MAYVFHVDVIFQSRVRHRAGGVEVLEAFVLEWFDFDLMSIDSARALANGTFRYVEVPVELL